MKRGIVLALAFCGLSAQCAFGALIYTVDAISFVSAPAIPMVDSVSQSLTLVANSDYAFLPQRLAIVYSSSCPSYDPNQWGDVKAHVTAGESGLDFGISCPRSDYEVEYMPVVWNVPFQFSITLTAQAINTESIGRVWVYAALENSNAGTVSIIQDQVPQAPQVQAIPEPVTWILFALGLAIMIAIGWINRA